MKKTHSAWVGVSTAVIALAWLVVAPAPAAAQRADRGGETVGSASPAPAAAPASAPAPVASAPATSAPASAGPSSSGDGDSRSGRADRSGGRSGSSGGTAVRREGGAKSGGSQAGNGSTVANGESGGRRARDGQNLGTVVPRGSVPIGTGGGVIFVPGGYGFYPWGYGGLGFGGYYGGYYDPWYYGGGGYPSTSYYASSRDDNGSLRLKVKPREASVYTDGYYVGHVDDFDGALQKLHLSAGPHRIEIRDPNYDTLMFDVRIQSDETITYRGELTKIK